MFYLPKKAQKSRYRHIKPAIAILIVAILGGSQLFLWWDNCKGSRFKEVKCTLDDAKLFENYEKQSLQNQEISRFSAQFSSTDIPFLIQLFEHKDPDLAYSAAIVLGEFSQTSLPSLIPLLSSSKEQVATSAKLALARMKQNTHPTAAPILSLLNENVQSLKKQSAPIDCSFAKGILLGTFQAENLTQATDAPELLSSTIKTLPKTLVDAAIMNLKEKDFPLEIDVYSTGKNTFSVTPVSAMRKKQCQDLIKNTHTLTIIAIMRTLSPAQQGDYCRDLQLRNIHPLINLKLNEICSPETKDDSFSNH